MREWRVPLGPTTMGLVVSIPPAVAVPGSIRPITCGPADETDRTATREADSGYDDVGGSRACSNRKASNASTSRTDSSSVVGFVTEAFAWVRYQMAISALVSGLVRKITGRLGSCGTSPIASKISRPLPLERVRSSETRSGQGDDSRRPRCIRMGIAERGRPQGTCLSCYRRATSRGCSEAVPRPV